MEQNGRVIANAIEREMARGGQTFICIIVWQILKR